jgi:predicted RNA methylase
MEQEMLGDFAPKMKPELSQWHTPPKLAGKMTLLVKDRVNCGMVLEPCAGGGNIIRALYDEGFDVDGVEIDPYWVKFIHQHPELGYRYIYKGDFLSLATDEIYDAVVMNPPFENGQDGQFIEAALKCAPQVITVLRTHALHGVERYDRVWSNARIAKIAFLVRRPKFGPGNGAKSEFCVVDIRRSNWHGSPRIEWWDT